jgi:uncharacterized membrane protein YoaT (DUF817 family)
MILNQIDSYLQNPITREAKTTIEKWTWFLAFFTLKQMRACLFCGLFFLSVLLAPKPDLWGIPRYDVLLMSSLLIQLWMLWTKLETVDEFKAICLFHLLGFVLEFFKTSPSIQSWSYPEFAYSKIVGVPLFAGFMYASVGSYIIQAWRLFDLKINRHPPYWMAWLAAILIYLNFFLHHYIGDYRWYITCFLLGIYARTSVSFRVLNKHHQMPLLLSFVLIGFFIWIAENFSTIVGLWQYPNQAFSWEQVHIGKWSSWSLLVIMSFTLIASLKHIKSHIRVVQ